MDNDTQPCGCETLRELLKGMYGDSCVLDYLNPDDFDIKARKLNNRNLLLHLIDIDEIDLIGVRAIRKYEENIFGG